jgi:sugar phosphate isomerase/epimerase
LAAGTAGAGFAQAAKPSFKLRYILSSAMYGTMPLAEILPEVEKTGSEAIDIWCKVHADHREQIDVMGHSAASALFTEHDVKPAVFTRYPLGPFRLGEEMKLVEPFGAEIVLCGTTKPSEPSGEAAKSAVKDFLEKMKPHVAAAEERGMTIAVENHASQLLHHPDSLRYFAEFNASKHLGVAFAPHHLHQWTDQIPALIRDLGDDNIPFMYFQEHSEGMKKKAPKAIEMQQMPGFGGGLDYTPIVGALKSIGYTGYCEIFMHPVPRGIPILPSAAEITAAINKSRAYVEGCLAKV